MTNITLRNVTSTGSLLPPGIIRCNETNPCTGFVFEDVNMRTPLWDMLGYGFITEFAYGESRGSTHPVPAFLKKGDPVSATRSWADGLDDYEMVRNIAKYFLQSEFVKEMLRDTVKQIVEDQYKDMLNEMTGKTTPILPFA